MGGWVRFVNYVGLGCDNNLNLSWVKLMFGWVVTTCSRSWKSPQAEPVPTGSYVDKYIVIKLPKETKPFVGGDDNQYIDLV